MPLGVAVLDADSRLRYWNPHAAALIGAPPMLAPAAPALRPLLAAGGRFTAQQAEQLSMFCHERIAAGDAGQSESWLRLATDRGRRLLVQLTGLGADSWLLTMDDRMPVLAGQGASDASLDALTGLSNRRQFNSALDGTIGAAGPAGRFALVMIDLDRFELVNETLGHPAGDALLVLAAQRLRREVREDDLLARLGGDEFIILAHGADGAEALAGRAVDVLSRPFLVEGHVVAVSASAGVVRFPEHGPGSADLMRCAELALRDAKSAGGRGWRGFLPAMAAEATIAEGVGKAERAAMLEAGGCADIRGSLVGPPAAAIDGLLAECAPAVKA